MDRLITCTGATLVVGDGDLGFAAGLSRTHAQSGRPGRVTGTTLEVREELFATYSRAEEHVEQLEASGGVAEFGVNATRLHEAFGDAPCFDTIVWNFPHHGHKGRLRENAELLRAFLLSARRVLRDGGAILVSLVGGQGGTPAEERYESLVPGNTWRVVEQGAAAGLVLDDVFLFDAARYPLYEPRGYRDRDSYFHLRQSLTHKFRVCPWPGVASFDTSPGSFVRSLLRADPMAAVCSRLGLGAPERVLRPEDKEMPLRHRVVLDHKPTDDWVGAALRWDAEGRARLADGTCSEVVVEPHGDGSWVLWLDRIALLDAGLGTYSDLRSLYVSRPVLYPEVHHWGISFFLPIHRKVSLVAVVSVIRDVAGLILRRVDQSDEYYHKAKERTSWTLKVDYQALEFAMAKDNVRELHQALEKVMEARLGVTLR